MRQSASFAALVLLVALPLASAGCGTGGEAPDPEELVRGLDAPSPATRIESAERLTQAGAGALAALRPAMRSDSWLLRAQAAAVLGGIGEPAIDDLESLLDDPDERVRAATVKQLDGIDSADTVEPLRAALDDASWGVRWLACRALGDLGADAGEAVPDVGAALRDTIGIVRTRAATTLAEIGAPAVDAARAGLADDDADVRRRAAWVLGQIGAPAAVAIPDLERALRDPDDEVRVQAEFALSLLRPESAQEGP